MLETAAIDAKDVLTWREGADERWRPPSSKAIGRHRDWSREAWAQDVPA